MSASSTTIQNQAAYLDTPGTPLRVGEAPTPTPASNEVVVKVHAVAINPADGMRAALGAFNPEHPWIFGTDVAGTVDAVGEAVTRFEKGDRVIAMSDEFTNHQSANSAFQSYMKVSQLFVAKVPSTTAFTDAAVIPLGLSTAASLLFDSETLGLRLPVGTPDALSSLSTQVSGNNEVVTIWGGSSSLGVNALQMAHSAGYKTIGIASARNFELMRSCDADAVFDYTDAGMEDDLVKYVQEQGWSSVGVAAAAGFIGQDTDAVARTTKRCGELALRLGGRRFVSTCLARGFMPVPEMPEGVGASNCMGTAEDEYAQQIWSTYIPEALESGMLKCMPPPKIVGEGLERINEACELINRGVSGQKLVVKVC